VQELQKIKKRLQDGAGNQEIISFKKNPVLIISGRDFCHLEFNVSLETLSKLI